MKHLKLLFMDVDGTMTDGKIYMGTSGETFKAFDIKDGYGIHKLLPENGIIPIIITARESAIVAQRCKELEITQVYQNCKDKYETVLAVSSNYRILQNKAGILLNG